MRLLQPVVWAKGTFLTPQYLQAQDRFLEELSRFRSDALHFRPWGFAKVRVDQAALAAGNFAITEASGIMADGLLFDMPNSEPSPPPKPIGPLFGPDQTTLDVYLSIPQYREGGFNVGGAARGSDSRYTAEVEMLRDETTGLSEKPVMVARKNFRLMAEGENRQGMSALQVARVRKTAAGLFDLDPAFVPPLLDFHSSDLLVSIARRLVGIMTAKSTSLSAVRRQKNQTLADFTSADIASFWLLYTINSSYPVIRHLFDNSGGHPEALYSAMLTLAGALTAFSTKVQPRDLPAYDHENLGGCFTDLDEKLRFLLETVVPSNFVSLPLKEVQTSIYATSIDRDDYLRNTRMYLAMRAETSEAELIRKTPQLVKICSGDYIGHLVQKALPGVPLVHVPTPPSAIPVKLDYQYFSLTQGGGPWEAVVRARNLAAYIPSDFRNPQAELIILLPQEN